ncbi:MAG: peptide/nickel transport system permease protein [Candidatus Krumholzibacteriia bacterium]|jgi:peptide/nickel transport system permease protein
MLFWFGRRILQSLFMIFFLLTAVFFVVRLAPGDPLDQAIEEEQIASDRDLMRQRMGLDQPLKKQYLSWLKAAVRGDFGESLQQQRPVTEIIVESLGPTLLLTVTAYFLIIILALAASLVMASRPGTPVDHAIQTTGLAFYSVPGFWLALMFILLFSRQLGWFPAGGWESPDAKFFSTWARALDRGHHLVLPVATLVLGGFMGTARYLRTALADVLSQDYIYAARARGLSQRRVLLRHGLRNALLPLITLMGLNVPFLLGGALIVEVVFGWPGMGQVTIEAIWARDYPVIMATTIIAGIAVVLGSTLADVFYRWADPRLRLPDFGRESGGVHAGS